jgi:hypothetical protein
MEPRFLFAHSEAKTGNVWFQLLMLLAKRGGDKDEKNFWPGP